MIKDQNVSMRKSNIYLDHSEQKIQQKEKHPLYPSPRKADDSLDICPENSRTILIGICKSRHFP